MTIELDFTLVVSVISVIVGVTVLITFVATKRRASIEEGKHLAAVAQVKLDADRAHEKIRALEIRVQEHAESLSGFREKLDAALRWLERIADKLEVG